jgi:TonB family protein
MKLLGASPKPLIGLFFISMLLSRAGGQEPMRISDTEATAHLLTHEEPVYPAIAKAAHVHGTVILDVTIDAAGKVTHITSVSGNAMLIQAAIDAVKGWKYRRFDEATGRPVIAQVKVPFETDLTADQQKSQLDQEVGKEYFPLDNACRSALRTSGDGALAPCRQEVAVAMRFPWQEQRHLEILDAHENLGRALLNAGKAKEAIEEFDLAIQIAEQSMKKTDAEYAYPLFWRASAERQLGANEAALKDYSSGEESMRLAIQNLPDMTKQYGFTLKRMLQQHAALLKQVNRDQEAAKLLVEADSIETP